jgi:hypothetical protein
LALNDLALNDLALNDLALNDLALIVQRKNNQSNNSNEKAFTALSKSSYKRSLLIATTVGVSVE